MLIERRIQQSAPMIANPAHYFVVRRSIHRQLRRQIAQRQSAFFQYWRMYFNTLARTSSCVLSGAGINSTETTEDGVHEDHGEGLDNDLLDAVAVDLWPLL